MATSHALGWALIGAAITKVSRMATRRALNESNAAPRLSRAVRRNRGLGVLLFAAAAGALLALGDMLQEQRKQVAQG